jgi:hypothetical protein
MGEGGQRKLGRSGESGDGRRGTGGNRAVMESEYEREQELGRERERLFTRTIVGDAGVSQCAHE